MKKTISILVTILLLVTIFAGCQKNNSIDNGFEKAVNNLSASDMDCFETDNDINIVALTNKGLRQKNLVIPANFETANSDIFYDNVDFSHNTLESIAFQNPNFELPDSFFYQCYKLKTIEFPSNITKIPYSIFYCCYSLEKIKIPSNVDTIGEEAFSECHNLKEISFNDALVTIESEAFLHTALEDITLPNSLTTIGEFAFADIPTLKSVVIPESVTSIAHNAFYYSDSDYGERDKPKISVAAGSWADVHFDEYTDGGLYAEKVVR